MHNQRKYLVLASLIFAFLFIGIYFAPKFFSAKKPVTDAVGEIYHSNADTSKQYKEGKVLFQRQCAACHILFRDFVGPDLIGLTKRGPWGDSNKILMYLRDPLKFYKENKSKYLDSLKKKNPAIHHLAFSLTEKNINGFLYYIDSEEKWYKIQIQ